MKQRKILYGVCGIGKGHTSRQFPIVEYYSKTSKIMIFAYGESLKMFREKYKSYPNIKIQEVVVPFFCGNRYGLDFSATRIHPANQNIDFFSVNIRALSEAESFLGRPDLVISDYEPVSAQYAYATGSPLITFDQQSKYLIGDFPSELNGTAYADEIARLMMFFPKADKRIASSFFKVDSVRDPIAEVEIIAPILRELVVNIDRRPCKDKKSLLVYFSSNNEIKNPIEEAFETFSEFSEVNFHVFVKQDQKLHEVSQNIYIYPHGDKKFNKILSTCNGIISTAGHSLLSEAMFLGIPVYAVPSQVYEQQMNAYVIDQNQFGIACPSIEKEFLRTFIENLTEFESNILSDQCKLLKSTKLEDLISRFEY